MPKPDIPQSRLERLCRENGMRMTGQRRIIARVLTEAKDHPDVEEVHRRVIAVDKSISLSTVYRTVRLFEEAGFLERHEFGDGRARYEQVASEHHDHLIDMRSGKVIEFHNEQVEQLQEAIARKLGYKLIDHRMELYGVPLKENGE
jgi:Fur family ferric uptake transcriptional regulator